MIPIHDVNDLPREYKITYRAREAQPGTDLANERFLLHQDHDMLVFSSNLDLQTLAQTEYFIADGTFEMVPKEFSQLYTIHGFVSGEGNSNAIQTLNIENIAGIPLLHALLRNKQRATYVRLFTVIRDQLALIANQQINMHHIILDFEFAAHEAARDVFQIQATGCLFHFGQSLIRWLQNHGLKPVYQNEELPLRPWINRVKAMSLVPPDLVLFYWNNSLRNAMPQLPNPIHQQLLLQFVTYFEVCNNNPMCSKRQCNPLF